MREGGRRKDVTVIKPVGWRQVAFTFFLLLCALFFVLSGTFSETLGENVSLFGTIILALAGLLNLLDQLFEWSRLKIDSEGFHLRSWWRKESFRHEEIKDFELEDYINRKLIVAVLKESAVESRGLSNDRLSFPCSFGRPAEPILKTLREKLKKTPGAKRKNRKKGSGG
ncbi:MAG: hypothetical protein HN531_16800 [Opitutae bacterium]|jgi:hypothetical protein|nr:hypothetical protein [Opitutae bacterium]